MEHQPEHGNIGLEDLQQVPADALTLAVFICREVEGGGVLDGLAQAA